ncbi:hypothetical protein VTI74DRAFT_4562 [Chaetomium olivicolor]
MSLLDLPYELVSYVVHHLDLTDIHNLSLSCRKFQFLVREPSIAKLLLESKAPYSAEARDARLTKKYASGLRRLLKRRDATASVSPFLVAIVGFAEEFLYENGVLCYIRRNQLRILDLHHSGHHEIVVDLRQLLHETLAESHERHKYKFQLLYYSHGIVSILYTQTRSDRRGSTHWLVVFNPLHGQVLLIHRPASISKLFVRNNGQFLYYGANSEVGDDGHGQWVLHGFDIATRTWLEESLDIPVVIGSDVGSTVCFEILGGYFYCVSNQTSLEVEEVDWVSYYTCFRFPLSRTGFHIEVPEPRQQLWRRDQKEGPIDDRWSFLRMAKDEATGQLKIIESRKEWLSGNISARRTYYTTRFSFSDPRKSSSQRHSLMENLSYPSADKVQQVDVLRGRARDPHMVHPGDDSSAFTTTLSKCPVRAYYPASQTFIDLVDDSLSFDTRDQRVRIRGGTRRLHPPGEPAQQNSWLEAEGQETRDKFLRQIDHLYRSETGIFWPPEENPHAPDPALANLYAVLNPPGYLGNPRGSWDERSLVYATGNTTGGLKALVFVSWDPSISLAGTPRYPGTLLFGRHDKSVDGNSSLEGNGLGNHNTDAERRITLQPDAACCPEGRSTRGLVMGWGNAANPAPWRTVERAEYRKISRGYHFAC